VIIYLASHSKTRFPQANGDGGKDMLKVLYVNPGQRSCLVEESMGGMATKHRLMVLVAGEPEPEVFDEGSPAFPVNPDTTPEFTTAEAFAERLGIVSPDFTFLARRCMVRHMTVYFNHQSDQPTPVPAGSCSSD